MCNFVPVRNWLIGLAIFVALADSSAWFAYFWSNSAFPWVGKISFWAAAGWCAAALITHGFALSAAITFCTCVAAMKACTTACTALTGALVAAQVALLALLVVCIGGGFGDFGANFLLTSIFLATAALAVLTIYIASLAITLGSCQAA